MFSRRCCLHIIQNSKVQMGIRREPPSRPILAADFPPQRQPFRHFLKRSSRDVLRMCKSLCTRFLFCFCPDVAYFTLCSTPCLFHIIIHLGDCSISVHKEQLRFFVFWVFLHLHNITSCRCTVIYLPNLYSLSLVITSSATMNNLGRVTFDRCTGIAIFLVLLLCPPCPLPYNPSTGAEESWGHGAGRTGEQKAKGRHGDVQAV